MDFFHKLVRRNIKISKQSGVGAKWRQRWEEVFAGHLTVEEKRSIHFHNCNGGNGYLWHVFSYGMRGCFTGEEAEMAFDREEKTCCYLFFQHHDDGFKVEDASSLKAADLAAGNGRMDLYVVDSGFNWTFVVTHESGWLGPYFSRR
ncbi:DUF4275 family protein [Geobacillus proteiniphilus]|uniref:DUF4275 family protein n=1 Tax=Geobacillus proteiniphilus TaxID=860353 RepID=A0A1Q5SZ06_9BACL|nr:MULTISPECIES: DUF4275 family protein [Geobacillus]OKO93126.1 hypothetical protein BRO54_2076 [Geobacillus proteiniphilus]OPX03837.1 hypothetical protein B1A75_06315 [Geobacillus sp. LEMMY01]WJQ10405.1 DUF4275 family protein [Geobacillus stearothermophilus]WMJ16442.1 DUF4275 family protein [Geobacillus proteiniphilus]